MPRPMLVSKIDILDVAKVLDADDLLEAMNKLGTINPPGADDGIPPIKTTERSISHVSYSDGHGEMKSRSITEWRCPVCNWFVGRHRTTGYDEKKKPCNFCTRCGQKIDWRSIELDDSYDAPVEIG